MPVRVTIQDHRLAGARHAVIVSATRVAVAAAAGRRVTMVDTDVAEVVGDSGDLGLIPGHLTLCGGKLWTITTDGQLVAMTTADAPVPAEPVALTAYEPLWLTHCGTIVIAPCGQAGIATINSSTRAVIDLHDGVLARIAFAVASASGYIYAFDGAGGGAVLTVSSAGAMVLVTRFLARDVTGPVHAFIDGTTLVVACERRQAVIELSLADPSEPVRSAVARYPGYTLRSVLDDDDHSPLTDEPYALFDLAEWFPVRHGLMLAGGTPFLIHEAAGRATLFEIIKPVDAGEDQSTDVLDGDVDGSTTLTPDPTYLWEQFSGPPGVTFGTPTMLHTTWTLPGFGTFVLSLTVTVGATETVDYITIISLNAVPIVNAGVDQAIHILTGSLVGTASDPNSLPSPLTYLWTKVSGPSTVAFGASTALSSSFTLGALGTYVLRLTASDGLDSTSDDLTIVASNTAPTVNAGTDQAINILTGSLVGTASDPDAGQTLTYAWSKVSGPSTLTFGTGTALTTTFTAGATGSYVARLTVSDGFATVTDDVTLFINAAPTCNAGIDQTIGSLVATLLGTASDSDSLPSPLTYAWSKVSGDGTVVFSAPTALSTTATFPGVDTYVLRLTVSDGLATATDDIQIAISIVDSRAIIAGGWTNAGATTSYTSMDYFQIDTAANAGTFGNLDSSSAGGAGCGSTTVGVFAIGMLGTSTWSGDVHTVTYATLGDSVSGYSLDSSHTYRAGHSSATRGIFFGGIAVGTSTSQTNISYIAIPLAAGGSLFGDLQVSARYNTGASGSTTRALVFGGVASGSTCTTSIEYVEIATIANASSFGSLTAARGYAASFSSATRAVTQGGLTPNSSSFANYTTTGEYVTIASAGGGTSFGNLTMARSGPVGVSNKTRGVVAGGADSGGVPVDTIDYTAIATGGAATNFGNLVASHKQSAGMAAGHGGLV